MNDYDYDYDGDPLRPSWDEFIGQDPLKHRLDTHMAAAVKANRPLDHVFLAGPPGFGKTSMANIIAARVDDPLTSIKMPVRQSAFLELVKRMEPGVLFIDEVHAAPKAQQEDLLTLLESGYLSTLHGTRVHVPWLTVIAATTEPEKVIAPLYDRFPIKPNFSPYTDDELGLIVTGMAKKVGVKLRPDDAIALGKAAGGTPRNCKTFVFAARDLRELTGKTPTAAAVLSLCEVEPDGLTQQHVAYLKCLNQTGGAAGLRTIGTHMRLHESVLRDLERLLIDHEFITYTERGREMTSLGFRKLAAVGGR